MNGLAVTDRESVCVLVVNKETNFAAFQVCKKIPGASLRVQNVAATMIRSQEQITVCSS
jgi:hypothetical protein